MAMTVEQVIAELKTLNTQFFTYIETKLDEGKEFATAVMEVSREYPDLTKRENQLRGYLKAFTQSKEALEWLRTISAADLHAWAARKGTGREVRQVSDNEWNTVNAEVDGRVKQVMAAKGLEYGPAFKTLMAGDRDLWRRYNATKARCLSNTDGRREDQAARVHSELLPLVQERIAASEGMDYGQALKAVLGDRPDLARRYKDTIR